LGVVVQVQRGADLGERLSGAFADLVASPGDRAVAIGADCPDLNPSIIREAFATLDRQDVVLGPAADGGYYLIGLRRGAPALFPALFNGIHWGTGTVLAETLARAEQAGLGVTMLSALSDIDTPGDVVRFVAQRIVSPPGPGARTEAALSAMGLLPPRS
jgi:rSAM/selenodomain-associated transferase 1